MNIIPKKYLSHKYAAEARTQLRKWLMGKDAGDAARELLDAYEGASDADCRHLAVLMTMVFDLQTPPVAAECARLFGFDTRPAMSVGEAMLVGSCAQASDLAWLKSFSKKVGVWNELSKDFDTNRYPLIAPPDKSRSILTISAKDGIYAFRHTGGMVDFFAVTNTCEEVLVDEERFNDEYPLYFCTNSHFVSPVFMLKAVRRLFEFVAAEIGYPTVKVNLTMILNNSAGSLINADDYSTGGIKADEWEGIVAYERRDYIGKYLFDNIGDFLYNADADPSSVESSVMSKLIEVLAAVSIMYKGLNEDYALHDLTKAKMTRYARKLGIFRPKVNDDPADDIFKQ